MRVVTPRRSPVALRIVVVYLAAGTAWILFSDQIVLLALGYTPSSALAQTAKGLFYVGVTGVLLGWLIHQHRDELGRQAFQAQSVDLVGRLAAGVAHDFNNILTAALGLTRLLRDEVAASGSGAADLTELQETLQRGSQLAARLMQLGRPPSVEPPPLSVNELLQTAERLLQRAAGPQARLRLELASDLPLVAADAGQIEQVVLNLVLNAGEAMPEGGTVEVTTARASLTGAEAAALLLPAGGYLRLQVADTGRGMSDEELSRIFELFYSSKTGGGNHGVGLASTDAIVTALRGRITVESKVGEGTTFSVWLPALPER
ncbi:MAG: hypothetical protein IT204_05785 [Fimbriimonadaceae bacterium]|nr:hypothetical protein [Fimbriimonadaceae bacterium]